MSEKPVLHPPQACQNLLRPRWPKPDYESIERIAGNGAGLADLWESSPFRLETNEPRTEEIIDALFPGNPMLCCAWYRHNFETRPKSRWHKLDRLQFIVPNPMTEKQGVTRNGKKSAHSLSNTGPRRFLVVEFDFDSNRSTTEADLIAQLGADGRDVSDLCACLLLHLAERAPLALVMHSGGKSLHGWFYCAGRTEEMLRRFMSYAVSLGADPATWTRSQFVRMPDGRRDNGNRQAVYFFNPALVR
jgi:hypothetical protein